MSSDDPSDSIPLPVLVAAGVQEWLDAQQAAGAAVTQHQIEAKKQQVWNELNADTNIERTPQHQALVDSMLEQMAQHHDHQSRQLSAADDALMKKLQKGKPSKHAKLIEAAFQHSELVQSLQQQEQAKQDEAMQQKLVAKKKKRVKVSGDAADESGSSPTITRTKTKRSHAHDETASAMDHAVAVMLAVQEAKALKPDLSAAEIADLQSSVLRDAGAEAQLQNADFMALLQQLMHEEAGHAVVQQRELSAADEALLKKLQKGKNTKQQALIDAAFRSHTSLLTYLQEFEKKRQEEDMKFKLAQGKMKNKRNLNADLANLGEDEKESSPVLSADMVDAVGREGADEFMNMLKATTMHEANKDIALQRQMEQQRDALMKKLMNGKSTAQKKIIEKAFRDSGMVDEKKAQEEKRQDEEWQMKLKAGKIKKKVTMADGAELEQKYEDNKPEVVDYLQAKYGAAMAEAEAEAEAESQSANALKSPVSGNISNVLANQTAIAAAAAAGMATGADAGEVAALAAQAAASGMSAEQITAVATQAAKATALLHDNPDYESDQKKTFMDLFSKVTQDMVNQDVQLQKQRAGQDDDFLKKLQRGKQTKHAKMIEKAMADAAAQEQAKNQLLNKQEDDFMARLARGKQKRPAAAAVAAAEAIAAETLVKPPTEQEQEQAAKSEADTIANQPTLLDEILQQTEQIEQKMSTDTAAASSVVDNIALQLMLEKAKLAEQNGDEENAKAFMEMYRKMVEEQVSRDQALKRQLNSSELALMAKLQRGKTTKQQKLIEQAFQNSNLVDALQQQEQARQQEMMNAKLAAGKQKKQDKKKKKAAEEAFQRLRKIFLGAIKKLPENSIIRNLEDCADLIDSGYLDLNKPIKDSNETMLHNAAKYGKSEVVNWLLTHGKAIVNQGNAQGQSALHFAASALDPNSVDQIPPEAAAETCKALIDRGGDVHLLDQLNQTPQTIAASFGFDLSGLAASPEAMAALARQKGGEDENLDADEMARAAAIAAAAAAAAAEATAKMQEVQSNAAIDPATGLPFTAQQLQEHKEAAENLERIMQEERLEILPPPPPPNQRIQDPQKIKQANMVFLQICDLMKDINSSPKHELEIQNLLKSHQDLIREGYLDLSKPIKSRADGSTLLHAAVFHQKLGLVRSLLNNRADPNKITMTGETPLHIACMLADREHGLAIISLLLEAGADPKLKEYKTGKTPFELAPNAATRQWMNEWKPWEERQRLALAAQMGGLDDLMNKNAANIKKSALQAEDSFLQKLMRGKITKQGRMVDEALNNKDLHDARKLSEEQKQLEAFERKLAKGKARRGFTEAAESMSAADRLAAKKRALMEEMLLQELSENTKEKILLCTEKYIDHPLAMQGLDIGVLSKLRGVAIADAMKLLGEEMNAAEQTQATVQHAAAVPGLDQEQVLEYERQYNIMDCNRDIYTDLINNMLATEKAKQQNQSMSELESDESSRAAERLRLKKEAAARKKQQSHLPAGMLEDICKLLSEYIAQHTGYVIEPSLIQAGAMPLDELKSYGLDTEVIQEMVGAVGVEEAKAWIAKQMTVNQAVQQHNENLLADPNLPTQQKEECELRQRICQSNSELYQKILNCLQGLPSVTLSDEEASAAARLAEKLAKKKAKQDSEMVFDGTGMVHPDTGLSAQNHIQDAVMEQIRELAAEHLGLESSEMRDMSVEQLQMALVKAGVNVDVLEELRKLTEAEAGKYLAREMARNEAENDMIRKLLRGKGLTEKKRAELLARQKQLDDANALYNDMLSTLLTGEKKKFANMSKEEQLAQERMLAKLAARKLKMEQQELKARKQLEAEEMAAQQMQMQSEGDMSSSSMSDVSSKAPVMHQLIMDNPQMLESFNALGAEQLGKSIEEFKSMSAEEQQLALAAAGIDVNLLEYLKQLTDAEAAKHLAKQMARDDAEAKMLKKLLAGKGLTAKQREELLARQKQLEASLAMYDDLMKSFLDAEKARRSHMSKEEQMAHDRMMAKMAMRNKMKKNQEKQALGAELPPEVVSLFNLLTPAGPWECRVCQTLNEPGNTACKFCKADRGESIILSEATLLTTHQMFHQCSCSPHVIDVVHRAIGPCIKRNFMEFMQATIIACNREQHVIWDTMNVDYEGYGCVGNSESELIWSFNDWDIPNPRYHVFKEKRAGLHGRIGWQDFREEMIQMPNLQDYF